MALVTSILINGLIAAEEPPSESTAQAAERFSGAFINYFKTAGTGPGALIIANAGVCELPSTRNALVGGVTGAFSLVGGPAVSDTLGLAILAYINAGPAGAMFSGASAAAITSPLSVYTSAISAPVESQNAAKSALAAAIQTWLGAGVLVTIGTLTFPIT